MILFAYASNMNVDDLATHVKSAKKISNGYLPGYSFILNRTSGDLSAKANIMPCNEPNAKVWGVLIEISDEDSARFFHSSDDIELIQMLCYDTDGKAFEAEVFVTPPHATNNYLLPYDWYLEKLTTYARQQQLPEPYINNMARMESKPDPDKKRRERRLKKFRK